MPVKSPETAAKESSAARDFVTQFDSKVDAMLKKKSTTGEAENR